MLEQDFKQLKKVKFRVKLLNFFIEINRKLFKKTRMTRTFNSKLNKLYSQTNNVNKFRVTA